MIVPVGARTLLTVEEFEQLPDQPGVRFELDRGELVEVSAATYEHNRIRGALESALRVFLAAQRIGEAVAEQEFRLGPDTVRRPDVAFLRSETVARIDKSKSILEVVPDLVAEVVSPNDTAEKLMRKVDQFLAAGCSLVWVVYPAERKVHVYEPNDLVRVLSEGKNVQAPDLLPGFSFPVSRLFE